MAGIRAKLNKFLALAAVCVTALMLTGCGASLTLYDYTSNGVRYNMYELTIDNDTVAAMDKSAQAAGSGYTVRTYFLELFEGFGYELAGAEQTDKAYTVRYVKVINGDPELYGIGSAISFETTHTENPFVRTYTSVSPNPFNGVRKAYDEAERDKSITVVERIKNGIVARDEYGERVSLFPSIVEAFPYLESVNIDGLLLNYARSGSSRMKSSGTAEDTGDKSARYVFSRYFDDSETTIAFEYKRAVPYGWYLTAIAAGAVTLTIIVLVTRTKKQKPTLLDRFPYNPEEYRDYDSYLPSNR